MLQKPYGKTTIDYDGGDWVLTSGIDRLKAEGDGRSIVKAAMAKPIDSLRLAELQAKLGGEIMSACSGIVVHDCRDQSG